MYAIVLNSFLTVVRNKFIYSEKLLLQTTKLHVFISSSGGIKI